MAKQQQRERQRVAALAARMRAVLAALSRAAGDTQEAQRLVSCPLLSIQHRVPARTGVLVCLSGGCHVQRRFCPVFRMHTPCAGGAERHAAQPLTL